MKIIALVDPLWGGHHTAYLRIFSETLINKGYTVWCFKPVEETLEKWIADVHPEWTEDQISTFNYSLPDKTFTSLKRFNEPASTLFRWRHLHNAIRQAEKKYRKKVSHVFIAWVDSYLSGYLVPFLLDIVFPYYWSGLYFHPRHLRTSVNRLKPTPSPSDIDIALSAKKCISIAIHDEGILEMFKQRTKKNVVLFPEIADATPADKNDKIAQQIQKKANGRVVIGAIGLHRHQGLLTLLRVAKNASSERFFFVFAGQFTPSHFPDDELNEIYSVFNNLPENFFVYLDRLNEGSQYNAVFSALDIPFLVYDNFTSSSNRLTKAAIFQKYVLAQETFCVGEDVKKYHLGETVEAGNVNQCIKAIDVLYHKIKNEPLPTDIFETYSQLHSVERLGERFDALLNKQTV
ncbi:hypothetical protein QNI19_03360 [Cytophagaceae bacterium DM2B3-1]|uniref:Glycosyltransferase n=1 Tax=Xanthocytophaga flava TaxID=3048013 RepID=A0ABT7CDY7_9BACT|nr:hypothetical protein [Xanthocytophaga flavus]MDJ1491955.1 hypothetical protein [Xanthocytophaga flavus]